jgi:hypothetical protein
MVKIGVYHLIFKIYLIFSKFYKKLFYKVYKVNGYLGGGCFLFEKKISFACVLIIKKTPAVFSEKILKILHFSPKKIKEKKSVLVFECTSSKHFLARRNKYTPALLNVK